MTTPQQARTPSQLGIAVGPDAVVCLDLVLEDVGVEYHHLRVKRGSARLIIDLVDDADGYRIVDALRQHLGAELREATIYNDRVPTRVVCHPAWVEHSDALYG